MKNVVPTETHGDVASAVSGGGLSLRQALFREQHSYGLMVTASDGTITDWSPAATRIFGYSADEVLGKTPSIFHRPEDQPALTADILASVERDGYWAGETHIVRKDGSEGITDTVVFSYLDEHDEPATIGINRDITERNRIQDALRETAERLQLITDNVAALIVYFDSDQRYRFVNDAVIELLGKPREHIVGKPIIDLLDEEKYQSLLPYIEAALGGEEVTFEREWPTADGDIKIHQSNYLPHFDGQGRVLGCYGVSVDITERKRAEIVLRDDEQRLRLITDNMPANVIYFDTEQRFQFVSKGVEDLYGLPADEIIGKHAREIHGETMYSEVGPYIARVLNGEEVVFEQARTARDGTPRNYQSIYLPHLDERERVLGCYALSVDITARTQAETELKENEQRLRLATDNVPAKILYVDAEQRYQFVNLAVEEQFGLAREDIIGKHLRELQVPSEYLRSSPYIESALAGDAVVFEQNRTSADGSQSEYLTRYLPDFDDSGRVLGFYAAMVDITEQKRAETVARENEQRLRLITDNVAGNIFYVDADQRYQFVNKGTEEIFGMAREDIIGKRVSDVQDPAVARQVTPYTEMALAGQEVTFELERTGANGEPRSYQSTCLPHFAEDGEVIGCYVLTVDVTDRKRTETLARENEARLQLITDNVGAVITYLDTEKRYRFVNQNFADLLGLPRNEIVGNLYSDYQNAESNQETMPHVEAALGGVEVSFERSRTGADGADRSYLSTYLPHFDERGVVRGIYGLSVDITERKRAETEARENEQHLKLITDNVGASIVYFDAEQRYQFGNRSFEELHGSPAAEIIGKRIIDVLGEPGYRELQPHIEAALAGEEQTFEQIRTPPDGSKRTMHSTYLPQFDYTGKVLGCYALLVDITERVNADRELRENEHRLRLLTDNMPGHIIYLDEELRYRFVNKGVEDLFGLPREEIMGKLSREIQGGAIFENLAPKLQRVFAGEQVVFEQHRTSVDGTVTDHETTYLPHFGDDGRVIGCYVVSIDITERKRAETELQQTTKAAELLRKIAVAANHADNPDDAIQVCLDEVCAYIGWSVGHAYQFDPDGSGDLISANLWHFDDAARCEPFRMETERTRISLGVGLAGQVLADARPHWMEYDPSFAGNLRVQARISSGLESGFAIPVMMGRQVVAVLEFFTDGIVERNEHWLEITTQVGVLIGRVIERQHNEQILLDAKEEAELASRSKSEFLANMSHELRTPLNAIIGFSEIINQGPQNEVDHAMQREYAGHIHESGQHLLSLISDILDISKIETGNAALYEERVDVDAMVESCLVMVRERAESGGLTLTVEKPEMPLPPLFADALRIKQVLINLLSNAIKFTEPGGTVTLKSRHNAQSGFEFQIVDTGIGIAPDDIPTALGRFQQLDSDLNRKYQGTGLGLPLTKALVEQHGGTLELQSSLGVGTTVTVRLPADRVLSG